MTVKHLTAAQVFQILKAGGHYNYGGNRTYAVYGQDGKYIDSMTIASCKALAKRLRLRQVGPNVFAAETGKPLYEIFAEEDKKGEV